MMKCDIFPLLFLGVMACATPEEWACEDTGGKRAYGPVTDDSALVQFRGVSRICGDLLIGGEVSSFDDLEELEVVEGSLVIKASGAEKLRFPNLLHVEGHFGILDNVSLVQVELPHLVSVGEELAVVGNSMLTQFDWPELRTIDTSLQISSNAQLTVIDMPPQLREVQAIHIGGNDVLEHFVIPRQVVHLEGVLVVENAALKSVVGGEAVESVQEVVVAGNPALVRVELKIQGVVGSLGIAENAKLTNISGLDAVQSIERLVVSGNSSLVHLPGVEARGEMFVLYVSRNFSLNQMSSLSVDRIYFAAIIGNPSLSPLAADAALAAVDVQLLKIDGNAGQEVPHTGPCPWEGDGECDEDQSMSGVPGTGLCSSDGADCDY